MVGRYRKIVSLFLVEKSQGIISSLCVRLLIIFGTLHGVLTVLIQFSLAWRDTCDQVMNFRSTDRKLVSASWGSGSYLVYGKIKEGILLASEIFGQIDPSCLVGKVSYSMCLLI